jgi:carboxyl-terminal processing protease
MAENYSPSRYVGIFLVIAFAFLGGWYVGYERQTPFPFGAKVVQTATSTEGIENVDLSLFWKTWQLIDEKYPFANKPNNKERVYGAVQGLVASLGDPYTVFFPPTESKEFMEQVSGTFEGIGAEIGIRNNLLTVIAPLKGTPADRAGVRAGDRILKINGTSTVAMTDVEAVRLLRGKRGTSVSLELGRETTAPGGAKKNENISVTIVREPIDIPVIQTESRKDGVFVIALYNFSAPSAQKFEEALGEFKASGDKKLIIDLRGNPGGYLEAAVDMASFFIPKGEVIVRESEGEGKEEALYKSKGYDLGVSDVKIAILVDGGSASASEIFAGALSEHNVATLIGEKTFGKGSVQEVVPLPDKTSLKITIAKWLTPKGVSISEKGITPAIKVSFSDDDRLKGRDPQKDRAVLYLLKGK